MAPTDTVIQHLLDLDPVGAGMAWVAAYSLAGLFSVALTERFLPIMPSYGVLLAVGITAEDGGWSLSSAFSRPRLVAYSDVSRASTPSGRWATRARRVSFMRRAGSSACHPTVSSDGARRSAAIKRCWPSRCKSCQPFGFLHPLSRR